MKYNSAVVILNGELRGEIKEYKDIIDKYGAMLIAADGGALFLDKLAYKPDIIIGDMDSIGEELLLRFSMMGIKIIKFPVEKNETDGELALNYCRENKYHNITIIGSQGGRLDQQFANIFLLEYAVINGMNATIREPGIEIGIIKNNKVFKSKTGFKLSLIPLDIEVNGVSISGCKYNLISTKLMRYRSRGISNLIENERAVISVNDGLLLYILRRI
jgi:thiamine pyrophosphokinase